MNRALPRIVKTAFALALAVLTANAVLTYRDVHALRAGGDSIDHTHGVIAEIRHTISILQNAEIGQRSYLLTGEREHLELYGESVTALGAKLDCIAALTRENPRQQATINQLRAFIAGRVGELKCALRRFEQRGGRTTPEAVLSRRESTLMESARAMFAKMEREEERVLAERSSAYRKAADRTIASSVVTTGTAGGLLLAVAFLARKLTPADAGSPESGRRTRALVRCRSDRAAAKDDRRRTTMTDKDVAVLVVIAVAVLGLCAVLLVVSRL